MENISFFTPEEKAELFALYKQLIRTAGESITKDDTRKLKNTLFMQHSVIIFAAITLV